LGGFFDGILLHQILQWHHLLSEAEWAREGGLALQLVADGVFHALMYVLALVGLGWLWRRRRTLYSPGAGAALLGWMLVGFGLWHVLDAILSHWLLGIHRVRSGVTDPLAWDIGWLVVFGVVPLLLGTARLRRRPARRGRRRDGRLLGWISALVVVAAAMAGTGRPAGDVRVVVFMPHIEAPQVLSLLDEVGGSAIRSDREGKVWAISVPPQLSAGQLHLRGALLVSGAGVAGCADWLVPARGIDLPARSQRPL